MSLTVVLCSTSRTRPAVSWAMASIFPPSAHVREAAPVAGFVKGQRNSCSTASVVSVWSAHRVS